MVYQGSKRKYAKFIVPILQEELYKYRPTAFIDACCGGCNIIDKINYHTKIAIDNNPYLIELYKYAVKGGHLPTDITKEEFYERKANPDTEPLWRTAFVGILGSFLSGGFHKGYINLKEGSKRNQKIERIKNFQSQIPLLRDIHFLCKDINDLDVHNCLIYIDPPYKGTSGYDNSKDFDYEKFWNTVRRLSKNNIVYVSEESAPDDFEAVWSLETKRTIKGNVKISTENLFKWKG